MSSNYWILKSEPTCYAYADLEREGRTVWDGVTNNGALIHIRKMAPGDTAVFYHSGDERAAVGVAEIVAGPYPDPKQNNEKLAVVDVRPVRRLARPVTLAELKEQPEFEGSTLLRQGRLSIVPLTEEQWRVIAELGGGEG